MKWAVRASIPFVIKSGGHSEWSTIDSNGMVIDLSKYTGIEVDSSLQQAKLRGSVLSKELAVTLASAGLFTALGNGNPVGAIPYFLNGGASVVTSRVGYGSDQIIAARMIDAKGEIVEVTEEKQPELLWALRGAGQFFGLVTELTIRVYPFSTLGNGKGLVWSGLFVFPLERADEVSVAMDVIANNEAHDTAGLVMVMAPPPQRQPAIVVAARYTGNVGPEKAYQALHDLGPLKSSGASIPIQNLSDGREAFNAKGGFKRFETVGLRNFNRAGFIEVVALWKAMVAECTDAITTSFNFQWNAQPAPGDTGETCSTLHDVRMWQNNFIWHTDASNRDKVDQFSDRAVAAMRGTDRADDWIDFQNATRTRPIEFRFRNPQKLAKLKKLKAIWDPTGVFTRQLLDA